MTRKVFSRTAASAAALMLSLTVHTPGALAASCQAQIDAELERLSIAPGAIESVNVKKRSFGAKAPTNFVYDAWIRLESCDSGYLVINLTRGCMVKQSYTTGDCSVEGLSDY
jgi:hypothetical protein